MTALPVSVAFEKARADGRAALVGYLPAGFPNVAGGIAALRTMVDAGCDVIEVGLPYSDPVMDGPTIQRAAQAGLAGVAGEVGRLLVLDREAVIALADELGIFVVGVDPSSAP